mmetsp:Transcript_3498/g.6622  ORF Transcript_3498/g.6622 Transcript_3498/m.6622 type:complete len:107 (+) Transcript_3498:1963-2283(+)
MDLCDIGQEPMMMMMMMMLLYLVRHDSNRKNDIVYRVFLCSSYNNFEGVRIVAHNVRFNVYNISIVLLVLLWLYRNRNKNCTNSFFSRAGCSAVKASERQRLEGGF